MQNPSAVLPISFKGDNGHCRLFLWGVWRYAPTRYGIVIPGLTRNPGLYRIKLIKQIDMI
jgi:hypothetical protein